MKTWFMNWSLCDFQKQCHIAMNGLWLTGWGGTVMRLSMLPSLACPYLVLTCCESVPVNLPSAVMVWVWFVGLIWFGGLLVFAVFLFSWLETGLRRGKTGSMVLRKPLLSYYVCDLKFMPLVPFSHHAGPPSAVSHEDDACFHLSWATQQRYQDELATNHILTIYFFNSRIYGLSLKETEKYIVKYFYFYFLKIQHFINLRIPCNMFESYLPPHSSFWLLPYPSHISIPFQLHSFIFSSTFNNIIIIISSVIPSSNCSQIKLSSLSQVGLLLLLHFISWQFRKWEKGFFFLSASLAAKSW